MATTRSLVTQTSEIIGLNDKPVLRNLLITQCYHDLSAGLAAAIGADNANWCTYATWASKTAGKFIRNEEVPGVFRGLLEKSPAYKSQGGRVAGQAKSVHGNSRLDEGGLLGLAEEVLQDVSGQITEGNLKVFSELGPIFARFIECFDGTTLDRAAAESMIGSLKSGPSSRDGQTLLKEAFGHYVLAAQASDAETVAQHMLVANALTGLHEQIRLQSFIAGSLNAPIEDALGRIWDGHVVKDAHPSLLDRLESLWERTGHVLTHEAEKVWADFSTAELMTLAVPGQVLDLGSDLPPVKDGEPLYPSALASITTEAGKELCQNYDALDPDQKGKVGAEDWTQLAQRMKYIIALFRSRQQTASLQGQPFTPEQHEGILAGEVPAGPLSNAA